MAASDTNRVRLTSVEEVTLGTTPDTPRMRRARMTGEGLQFQPAFTQSAEIRDDRMNADPSKTNETNQGPINGELSYPVDLSPFSAWLKSLFFNPWVNTPSRDNDGVADSVITGVAAEDGVITVLTGAPFVVGHLVRASGFTNAGNNGLQAITTGSATVPAVGDGILTDEAAPPATARLKVVGLQGTAGDIVAVADGLTSTTLDFTTFGLVVGQWVKIGATGAGFRLATAACNGWARVIAIAAHKLTLDNLPTGWATDTGTGKTLRVFFGDTIKNGVTTFSETLERGFMAQAVPSYIIQRGMIAGQGEFNFQSEQLATWTLTFTGMTGEISTTSLDDAPDPATTNRIMSAAVNVGRIAEAGVSIGGPNFIKSLKLTINNNLRPLSAIRDDGQVGPVDIGSGSADVTVALESYFGSAVLLQKLFAGTATNLNARVAKDSQAIVFGIPRVTFTDGSVSAGGKNQDAMLPLTAQASIDPLTNAHVLMDRLEYFEV
jgi:hypothetical protein